MVCIKFVSTESIIETKCSVNEHRHSLGPRCSLHALHVRIVETMAGTEM